MAFEDFNEKDWEFFEAAAIVGLDCPGLDGDAADEALAALSEFGPLFRLEPSHLEALCEAFDIGWNVATENGMNDLAPEGLPASARL